MTDKTTMQSFQADWGKTLSWAQQNKIPASAYLPVYQQDSQRLLQYGSPMSQSERIRAVSAAAGLNYSTSLPTDQKDPTNILGNTKSNLTNIFTGLNPTHLFTDVVDTIKNTFEPSTYEKGNFGADLGSALSNTLLSFIPGASDVGTVLNAEYGPGHNRGWEGSSGNPGLDALAENPLTSLLDVMPLMKFSVLSKTAFGSAVAEKAGVAPEELAAMTPGQAAWAMIKKHPTKLEGPQRLADGTVKTLPYTIGQRINLIRNHKLMGTEQGDITKNTIIASEELTKKVADLMGPIAKYGGKLSKDELQAVTQEIYNGTRTDEEILGDDNYTPDQKKFFEAIFKWGEWNKQLKLQSGDIVYIKTPFGKEPYTLKPGSSGDIVNKAKDAANNAADALRDRAKIFDAMAFSIRTHDVRLGNLVQQITALKENIHQVIKASIPELPQSAATDTLRQTLPEGEKWERQVLKSNNLESYFGKDERTIPQVRRGAKEYAEPFTGSRSKWSQQEKDAWAAAEDALWGPAKSTRSPRDRPTRAQVKSNAIAHLKALGQITDKKVHAPVYLSEAKTLFLLVGPGGLVEQMTKAWQDGDWSGLAKIGKVANQKLHAKGFTSPNQAPALKQLRGLVDQFDRYAKARSKAEEHMRKIWYGEDRKGNKVKTGKHSYKNSLEYLTKESQRLNQEFIRIATEHPPDVWRSAVLEEYTRQVMNSEEGAKAVDAAAEHLKTEGWSDDELTKLRSDPRAILEMMSLSAKASYENAMLPNLDFKESRAIQLSAYKEISNLRAQGKVPRYIPTISPFDIRAGEGDKPFNVFIGVDHVPTVDSAHSRLFDFTSSVYNLQAALLKETRQQIGHDGTLEFLDDHVFPHTFTRGELEAIIRQHAKSQLDTFVGPDKEGSFQALVEQTLKDWNLVPFNPQHLFGVGGSPKFSPGNEYFINSDLLDGITQSVSKFQRPAEKAYDKVTGVFRESILGYSPRFIAHILLGGTALLAYRSSIDIFTHIRNAFHIVHTGELPEDVSRRLGGLDEKTKGRILSTLLPHSSTQEGAEDIRWQNTTQFFHGLGAHDLSSLAKEENAALHMARTGADKATAMLEVVPQMTYRLTHFVTNMHRSLAFLDGLKQASKKQSFFVDEWDEDANKIVRKKHDMTADQALNEAMQHVEKVMGDLRSMSPIERNALIRIFPFYGWTKHVLKYVASYPMDHSYRAAMLSQLATMNSKDVASGLPLRIQLLYFLGQPDKYGNVNAIDVRALNPLRDTANYASLQGWLSGLNPIITLPFSQVDPEITFGGNVLYPTITYNSLYGIDEAGPSGNKWSAAESVVPELSAVDAAFNLSGQYAYLRQTGNHAAFVKKIAESLNFPWVEQQLNLRQIASSDELKRYQQAKTAANNAWTSGDFSQLAGYGAVPDPRNTQYDITPEALQQVYNSYKNASGLPPAVIANTLPNPQY